MGSHYGTCEIVELEDEPKPSDYSKKNQQIDKGKKPRRSIEDDINKLFESINVRTSFHGLTLSDETSGITPRRNPSKKPMRTSTSSSSGIGYSDPLSLKQALRGLCISQASEMAAMKRLSKPPSSPALSDSGKLGYRSLRTSESGPSEETTSSSSSRKIPQIPQKMIKMKSTHLESNIEKSAEKVHPKEILLEPDSSTIHQKNIISTSCASYDSHMNIAKPPIKSVNKPTIKLRRKGRLPASTRAVKTVLKNKQTVKKKSKQESSLVNPLVCERCHCSVKEANKDIVTPYLKNGADNKGGEFTQSSNSSIGEYSSSTSINSEESRCSIGNKPHMSTDKRWQMIHQKMKQNGYLGLRHFNLLKKLGCGDIGTVYLAELVDTNCLFAIKVMDNEFLERRKKMPRAHTEREILRILDHPFLPTLYAHFVSENLSCLVMEYCPGGDLHVLRQKQPGRHYDEQAARFYVAEVLLALEYLHMLGIVYRDLKPENILVGQDGHIMLTDFDLSLCCSVYPILLQSAAMDPPRMSGPCSGGSNCIDPLCMKPTCKLSCFSPRIHKASPINSLPQLVAEPTEARSNSFVGTHEYLAPEIIKGEGHGSAVDWWTFGIFLYELLYGKTPFKGSGNDDTLANVVLQNLKFPDTPLVSFQARDLIKGLLVKEPENRLGSQRGASEIKQHPFFDGLNWALIRCSVPPEVPPNYDINNCNHVEFELF